MTKSLHTRSFANLIKGGLFLAALGGITQFYGCGDGGGGKTSAVQEDSIIGGTVSNNRGAITQGKVEIKDQSGSVVASTEFSGPRYKITVPASARYPIVISATAADPANPESVKAVVTSALADRMDISAITTDIVNNAIALGGLSDENIAKASGGAIGMRQSQGVSAGAGGSGGGPGNSGGGAGAGGHAGHNMSDMSPGTGKAEEKTDKPQ
jgi:hypothetical protein